MNTQVGTHAMGFESRLVVDRPWGVRSNLSTTIAIVGIDGSGKSTISAAIARHLSADRRVCRLSDDLECYEVGQRRRTPLLVTDAFRRAFGWYARRATSLAAYKAPKLAELLLRDRLLVGVQSRQAPDVIVMDGSPLVNLAAWSVLYGTDLDATTCADAIRVLTGQVIGTPSIARLEAHCPPFRRLRRLLPTLHLPGLVLMIDVEPAVALRRINSRGAKRQAHETETSLARLRRAYLQVLDVVGQSFAARTHVLDASGPKDEVVDAALERLHDTRPREVAHA